MKRAWVLAADASRARIFETEDGGDALREVETFAHPEGRAPNRELKTDGFGRYFSKGGGPQGHSATGQVDPAQHELDVFTKSIGDYVNKAGIDHRYDALYVVAPPKVLGSLRRHLSKEAQRRVSEELPKDVAWLSEPELERYLQEKGVPGRVVRAGIAKGAEHGWQFATYGRNATDDGQRAWNEGARSQRSQRHRQRHHRRAGYRPRR